MSESTTTAAAALGTKRTLVNDESVSVRKVLGILGLDSVKVDYEEDEDEEAEEGHEEEDSVYGQHEFLDSKESGVDQSNENVPQGIIYLKVSYKENRRNMFKLLFTSY